MHNSSYFFRDLPLLESFEDATNSFKHTALPDDWLIIITDVVGSTKAIEEGRYKDINSIGGMAIVAILNLDRKIPLPFIFGGDGATLAIPPHLEKGAISALLAVKNLANDGFKLTMRVGIVPASDLMAKNLYCGIAKYKVSPAITQAAFSGRGWEEAERLVKGPLAAKYDKTTNPGIEPEADYSGFECRWQNVPSRNGNHVALISVCTKANPGDHAKVYDNILRRIHSIYGDVQNYHPLSKANLQLSLKNDDLKNEITIKSYRKSAVAKVLANFRVRSSVLLGKWLMKRNQKTNSVDWGRYKNELIENSDFKKFDGMLRMLIDSTPEQRTKLSKALQEMHLQGEICFGLHDSSNALVTCVVFSHAGDHRHFLDGGQGGYTLAAQMLKEQLRNLRNAS